MTGTTLARPLRIAVVTFERFVRHEMTTYAAALAYRGLLALFPFVIFIIAMVNALDVWQLFGLLGDWASTDLDGRVPRAIKQWLVTQVRQQSQGAVLSIGGIAAVWAVASGARVLRRALNIAGNFAESQTAWVRLAISFMAAPVVATIVLTVMLLFLVTGGFLVQVGRWFEVNALLLVVWDWVRWPIGALLAALIISAVYKFAPSQRLPWRLLLPGATAAALAWATASLVLPQAVSGVLQFGVTYGSFSAAIVLLVYLYVTAAGFLMGAELNTVLAAESRDILGRSTA